MKSLKSKLRVTRVLILALIFCKFIVLPDVLNAQNVAITDDDGYTVNSKAMLDVKSINKGLLVPRVALLSTTDPVSGTKPEGLLIWNISTSGSYPDPGFYYWSGSNWVKVGSSAFDFQNGITQSGNSVKLGGALTESSTITQGAYSLNLNLSGTGDFNIQDEGTSVFFIRDNGNVGIGTSTPGHKLEMNGNMKLGDNVMLEGYSNYRVYRNLVSYGASTTEGAFVINTNQPMSSACMFRIKIEGYFYNSNGPLEITIGAYTYSGGFVNQGHINVGSEKLEVRLAQNTSTSNMAIILGDVATSYPHPKITVTEFCQGHNGRIESNAEGWTITQETDLSGFDHIENVPDRTNMDNRYYTQSQIDNLISGENLWDRSSGKLYPHTITDNVGIGTTSPGSRLEVFGNESGSDEDPLFDVKNNDGQTIFAVYPEGVRIYVDEDTGKGTKGGFAVGGFSSSKGVTDEYLRISPDSIRLYIREGTSKGPKGGFAVGGYSSSKGITQDFFRVTEDSTRIYVSDSLASGFAVSNIQDGDYNSLMDITTQNYFIGHQAGESITNGKYNIFLGYKAGFSTRGSGSLWNGKFNNFIGFKSGRDNTGGGHNTFIGYQSGMQSTSDFNTFIGSSSGYFNEDGTMNTYIGSQSGGQIHNGDANVIIGMFAGPWESDAEENTIIGTWAGMNSDGSGNVFIGFNAGATSSESNRLFIENSSAGETGALIYGEFDNNKLRFNGTVGIGETPGAQSLYALGDVVFGGGSSGMDGNSEFIQIRVQSDDWYIGSVNNASQTYSDFFIGLTYSSSTNLFRIENNGDIGIGRSATSNDLEVEGTASKSTSGSWLANSDRRIKKDIQDIQNPFETILKLHPVRFKYTEEYINSHPEIEDRYYYNYVAQEFMEVFPGSVKGSGEYIDGETGEILQLDSYNAQVVSVKVLQEIIKQNNEQQIMIEELQNENKRLQNIEQRLNDLEKKMK